jgi:transposase-like protein
MPARKTKLMIKAEQKLGEPLSTGLQRLYNTRGLAGTADFLGASKSTVYYWTLKFGMRVKRKLVRL